MPEFETSPKQRKAIESLILTGSITESAAAAGVHRKTIHEWLKQVGFKAALKSAESDALDNLQRELVSLSSEATATLRDVMGDSDAGIGHRLRASEIVLTNLLKLRELVNLDSRLSILEARLGNER